MYHFNLIFLLKRSGPFTNFSKYVEPYLNKNQNAATLCSSFPLMLFVIWTSMGYFIPCHEFHNNISTGKYIRKFYQELIKEIILLPTAFAACFGSAPFPQMGRKCENFWTNQILCIVSRFPNCSCQQRASGRDIQLQNVECTHCVGFVSEWRKSRQSPVSSPI